MIQILPAILATTDEEYQSLTDQVLSCEALRSSWIQIDFMDNKFVHNTSINPEVLTKYPNDLKKEAHLMVEYPAGWIDDLIKAKVQRIIFPLEDLAGVSERITQIKGAGIEVGISLNPKTPVAKVVPFISKIDLLLLMTVEPGYAGQELVVEVLEKVREARLLRSNNNLIFGIEVDGGVSLDNIKQVIRSGADHLVIGSHLLKGDINENYRQLQEAIK